MAKAINYISFDELMYRIRRNPLMEDALKSDLALDTYDLLKKIGAPGAYKDDRAEVRIENYKGEVPTNLLYIKEVNYLNEDFETLGFPTEIPMQYVIGNKKSHWHCSNARDLKIRSKYGYSINPGHIHADFAKGKVVMYYKSVSLDDDGYPLIPDVPGVIDAIVLHTKIKHLEIKAELGLFSYQIVERMKAEYYFAMGQAETSLKMPSPDEYESISRSMLRLVRGIKYDQ